MMRIVPVRIANSVVHFGTGAVAQGIDYAVSIGADVVSMSMGGLPSQAWADAVNKAYEAGVVVVCAAGNNFGGLPTSLVVYPARFDRVIAACGAHGRQEALPEPAALRDGRKCRTGEQDGDGDRRLYAKHPVGAARECPTGSTSTAAELPLRRRKWRRPRRCGSTRMAAITRRATGGVEAARRALFDTAVRGEQRQRPDPSWAAASCARADALAEGDGSMI